MDYNLSGLQVRDRWQAASGAKAPEVYALEMMVRFLIFLG